MTTPRIVGLGASAGGLSALQAFFSRAAPGSGLAYVVVQHLDPTQKALLPELLQRATAMRVHEAEHGMAVVADTVYVMPPNTEITLADGVLQLARPIEPRGMRLPINVFFSSLARALGERAIGVILSGMGADGTLGMQAIKAVGGLTLAQQPASAQFDSMPKSAIAAECADIVAPPEELAVRIQDHVDRVPESVTAVHDAERGAEPAEPVQRIVRLLQQRTRHDFSLYKPSTLHRRIERRMHIHGSGSLSHYADLLEYSEAEVDLLFKELLIGVTGFFRDPEPWQYLIDTALPDLLARRPESEPLRAWVVGCSTGEEAYSLAMALYEAAEVVSQPAPVHMQIFASDLSPDAIATARRGVYPLSISDQLSAERLARFFTRHETHYQVNAGIRDTVLFAQHDVVLDPPFTRLDVLACRNLLIYFDAALQRRLIPLFHYCLRPGGLLVLGSSETVGRQTHLFAPLCAPLRIYSRQELPATGGPELLLKSFPPLSSATREHSVPTKDFSRDPADTVQAAADQVLLQVYAPAAVLLNGDGDIVYISGRTGKYLEPAAGKANWNIHAMARPGLRAPIVQTLEKAREHSGPVHLHGLRMTEEDAGQAVDITVHALEEPPALRGMTLVVFRDAGPRAARQGGGGESATEAARSAEVQQYRDEIIALREEARVSREELQSSNEELQSANEELQSTNEELTTSKEETQSMNEELQTINNELQAKLDDLALAQSDMQNVLNSIEIAIVFLDQNLNVRRYTERASGVFNLRDSDVGRPLSDLTTTLAYPTLNDDAAETLRTLIPTEKQITAGDERWFSVRIMPYRRLDNLIDGVVITLFDITETKALEAALRQKSQS